MRVQDRPRGEVCISPSRMLAGAALSLAVATAARAVVVYTEDLGGNAIPIQNTTAPVGDQGWSYVGHMNVAGATLVAPQVIISAVHIGPGVGNTFNLNGVGYSVDYTEILAGSDIQISHLALSAGNSYAPIYTGVAAAGASVTMIGYGGPAGSAMTNTATSVDYGWNWTGVTYTKTWGNNTIAGITGDSRNMAMAFTADADKAVYTGGDSGAGLFINDGGVYKLAGVARSVSAYYSYAQKLAYPDASTVPSWVAPEKTGAIYSLPDANNGAAPEDQYYVIVPSGNTKVWALATGPFYSFASLIDNNSNNTYSGQTAANYINARITALSNTRANTTWIANGGSGNWATSASWSADIPINSGSIANFNGSGTQSSITLESHKSLGKLLFSGTVPYTLSAGAAFQIWFDNTGGIGNAALSSSSSVTQTINNVIISTSAASNLDILVSGGGTLNLAGGINNSAAKTVTFTNAASTLIVGNITNAGVLSFGGNATVGPISGAGSVSLNSGTLSLGSPSTYSGTTTVAGGTLLVSNTTGSATGTNTVTLNGGTLAGRGILSGTVAAGTNSHTIAPSGAGLSGTGKLTVGGLSTNANTTLSLKLVTPGGSSVNDWIQVTGNNGLALAGGTISIASHGLGADSLGYYKIIQYTGSIGDLGSVSLPATVNNIKYFLTTAPDPGFIDLHRGFIGDANDDGVVDLTDMAILGANWQQAGTWGNGDFNNSGTVDLTDLAMLGAAWQTSIGSFGAPAAGLETPSLSFQDALASVAFVPEPGSLALLAAGAASLLMRRRKA